MYLRIATDDFVLVLLNLIVVFGLVYRLTRQEIDWEERLRNYLLCFKSGRRHTYVIILPDVSSSYCVTNLRGNDNTL